MRMALFRTYILQFRYAEFQVVGVNREHEGWEEAIIPETVTAIESVPHVVQASYDEGMFMRLAGVDRPGDLLRCGS